MHQRHLGALVAWAQELRSDGLIEEFSVGPATLEDVYVDLVGRLDDGEEDGLGTETPDARRP